MKALQLNSRFLLVFFLVVVVCLLLFDKCENGQQVTYNGTDSLKQVIAEQTKIKDSLLIASKKKDTLRVEVIKRYTTLKHDTIIKQVCAPIIQLCDSIILVDSSLIVDLKHVIKLDSGIIANYKTIVKTDSTTIVGLNKEVKKQKKHKRWLIGGLIGLGVIAILK